MKRSEQLTLDAQNETNDLKALGLYNKALREKRLERWGDEWKSKIIGSDKVKLYEEFPQQGKITLHLNDGNIIDYYPKSNKLLIRKENEWKTAGLNRLIKMLSL